MHSRPIFSSLVPQRSVKNLMYFLPIHILSQSITPAASVLNLGVTFDENFNFKQHKLYRTHVAGVFFLPYPRSSPYSPVNLTFRRTTATNLVSSRLDYCNSLLYNTPNKDIAKRQRVQHYLARVVMRSSCVSATSESVALAPYALSHYSKDLYNYLSSVFINTTSISEFGARSNKKFQTAAIIQ